MLKKFSFIKNETSYTEFFINKNFIVSFISKRCFNQNVEKEQEDILNIKRNKNKDSLNDSNFT